MFPEIHLWFDTSASVYSQQSSRSLSPHACFSRGRMPDLNHRPRPQQPGSLLEFLVFVWLFGLHCFTDFYLACIISQIFIWPALFHKFLFGLHCFTDFYLACIVSQIFIWPALFHRFLFGLHCFTDFYLACIVSQIFNWPALFHRFLFGLHCFTDF